MFVCIPYGRMECFTQKLHDLPLTKKEARQFSRFFLAGAASCEVDRQGRILLPAVLRDFAQLDKEAVLVGRFKPHRDLEQNQVGCD